MINNSKTTFLNKNKKRVENRTFQNYFGRIRNFCTYLVELDRTQ